MVKKFSVDWLAQSFHDSASRDVPEPEKKTHRPHVPCLVQPRPPTSYDKVYLQPKPKVNKVEQTPEIGKEVTTPVTQRNCSSPSCKYALQSICDWFQWVWLAKERVLIVYFTFSFRKQRLFLWLWERSGHIWMRFSRRCERNGKRRSDSQNQNQIHTRTDRQTWENLQQAQILGRRRKSENSFETQSVRNSGETRSLNFILFT